VAALALNIVCLLACAFLVYVLVAFHDERRGGRGRNAEGGSARATNRILQFRARQLRCVEHIASSKPKAKKPLQFS
jgi:hypothetical protein